MTIGRNDPCRCGSGIKYKHCHYEVDSSPPEGRVRAARRVYDSNWQKNAAHYASQGCYKWMALQLKPFAPKRILDIGCGDGSGLLAILTELPFENFTIISIEENSECINTTQKNLYSKGYASTIIHRMEAQSMQNRQHILTTETGKLEEHPGVTLIEGDILVEDDELVSFLLDLPKFDAVMVWLIGTHFLRNECVNIAPLKIQSSGEYRLSVQNIVYELADKVLRSGGVLQIVDRGEVPATDELKQDFLNAHGEQASVTSLEVKSLDYMIYTEVKDAKKIKMIATPGTSGRIPDMLRYAMLSIISIKP